MFYYLSDDQVQHKIIKRKHVVRGFDRMFPSILYELLECFFDDIL